MIMSKKTTKAGKKNKLVEKQKFGLNFQKNLDHGSWNYSDSKEAQSAKEKFGQASLNCSF